MVHVKISRSQGVVQDGGTGFDVDRSVNNFGFQPYGIAQSGSVDNSGVVDATMPGFYLLRSVVGVTASLPNPSNVPGAMWILTSNSTGSVGSSLGGNFFVTASARGATSQFPFGNNGICLYLTGANGARQNTGNNMTVTGSITLISDGIRYIPLAVSGTHTFGT